jgi:hypothetical protein
MQDETTRSRCHRLSTYRLSRPLPEIGAFLDSITSNTGKLRLTEILFSLRLGWRALETTPRGIDLKKPWDMEGKGRIRGRPRSVSRLDIQGHDAPHLQQPSNAIASGNRKCKRCSTCYMEVSLSLDYLLLLPLALTASPAYQAMFQNGRVKCAKIGSQTLWRAATKMCKSHHPIPIRLLATSDLKRLQAQVNAGVRSAKAITRTATHGTQSEHGPTIPRVQKSGLNACNG